MADASEPSGPPGFSERVIATRHSAFVAAGHDDASARTLAADARYAMPIGPAAPVEVAPPIVFARHITERPTPPAPGRGLESVPILNQSPHDREQLCRDIGDAEFARRFRAELVERRVMLRTRGRL